MSTGSLHQVFTLESQKNNLGTGWEKCKFEELAKIMNEIRTNNVCKI